MSTFRQVNPETLIDVSEGTPQFGRGAWSTAGITVDSQYRLVAGGKAVGDSAETSLAHWAVSAAVNAIQLRLDNVLPGTVTNDGIFGEQTDTAVREFQEANEDPSTDTPLAVDGKVGPATARSLFVPVIREAEKRHNIPRKYLLGQTYWESAGDPGAVGYYIFYPDYRGVDRGFSQINSKAHPDIGWEQAFKPYFALNYSADRLSSTFKSFSNEYPQTRLTLWHAAIASHNSPVWGRQWAEEGHPPNEQIAKYVQSVLNARF